MKWRNELAKSLQEANALWRDGNAVAALERMVEAVEIAKTIQPGAIARVASPMANELVQLAIHFLADGDRQGATRCLSAVDALLDAMVEKDGRYATNSAQVAGGLGRVLAEAGYASDAIGMHLKAFVNMSKLGETEPKALVQAALHMNSAAIAVRYSGEPSKATMLHAKAYELLQAAPGSPMDKLWSAATITASNALSQWMCQEYEKAEKGFRFALGAYGRLPIDTMDQRIEVAKTENNFGNVLVETGRFAEAAFAYRRAEAHWGVIAQERPEYSGDLETTRLNLADAERHGSN